MYKGNLMRLGYIVFIILGSISGQAKSQSNNIYEESLQAFIKEIDTTYPFFDLKHIRSDWKICKQKLLANVKQCNSNNEFYRLLDQSRRCLRDSHVQFFDLKCKYPQPEIRYFPGISFLPAVDNQVVIMSCMPEYGNRLKPGMIVTAINGQNAREYLEREAKNSWNAGGYFSSPQRARLYVYRIPLQGDKGDLNQLRVLENGQAKTVKLVNKWKAVGWPHTYAMPKSLKRHGNCYWGKLDSGYGYIYLRRIRGELVEAVDKALESFGNIKGLIIDLRGNGGGGYGRDVFTRFGKKQKPSADHPCYRGDLVVLIDAGTMSAGETFARDLVYTAGAYLMGSTTAGSSSAKRSWVLPSGLGKVILPRRSRWGFDRQPIEFNGIGPHQNVEVVPAELQKGINSGIQRAEEYLNEMNEKRAQKEKGEAERKPPLVIQKNREQNNSDIVRPCDCDRLVGWYKMPGRRGTIIPVFKNGKTYSSVCYGFEIPLKVCPEGLKATFFSVTGTTIGFDEKANDYYIIIKDRTLSDRNLPKPTAEEIRWQGFMPGEKTPMTRIKNPSGIPDAKAPSTNEDFLGWYQETWLPVRWEIRKDADKYLISAQFYDGSRAWQSSGELIELTPLPDRLGFRIKSKDPRICITYNKNRKRFELVSQWDDKKSVMTLPKPLRRIEPPSPEGGDVPLYKYIGIPFRPS